MTPKRRYRAIISTRGGNKREDSGTSSTVLKQAGRRQSLPHNFFFSLTVAVGMGAEASSYKGSAITRYAEARRAHDACAYISFLVI